MDQIGEGLHLAGSIVDLTREILARADRDGPEKTLNEDTNNVQNSFADNNLDEQWRNAYRLFHAAGHPITPGGAVGETDRQFRYNALLIAAELKYARTIIARIIANSTKPK